MTSSVPMEMGEQVRLQRLHELRVLDSRAEPLFDALARAAAMLVGTPIALVSLVDENRQWFKANHGLAGVSETPRDIAFCSHAICHGDLLEIPDAASDPRFADNPLVTGETGIRFYAGAPIVLSDGLSMGSLCVIDRRPRTLDDTQRAILRQLARAAGEALEQRALARQRTTALEREADAERLLARDRARLAHLIEATRAGTWDWNVQTGEVRLDERWAQLIGYTVEELGHVTAKGLFNRIHPDDLQESDALMRRHFSGEIDAYDFELRIRHRDGRWIWVHGHGRVVSRTSDGQPEWMYGMHRDISVRKQAELALASSKAFLARTGRVAGVGGWEIDLATHQVEWTEQTCRIHERPPGYRPTLEESLAYYTQNSRPVIEEAMYKAEVDGSDWDLELPIVTARGNPAWVRVTGTVEYDRGRPSRLAGAIQDITLRKRATEAMEVSERRFRKLFQYSLGLICTHDLSGIILSVNPAAAHSIGHPITQLMGRSLGEFMPADLRPMFDAYLKRIAANGIDSGLLELVSADGRRLTWQYHNVLDDEGGEPYVLGHAQDITERQRQEKQLLEWSVRDALTGCFNRRYLDQFESTRLPWDTYGCVAIDLDHFKQVNDTYGHQRGDEVLVAMARFLTDHVREGDAVVRVGGDEFLLLLNGADERDTQAIIERIDAHRARAPIGFTIGVAMGEGDRSMDAVLALADKQLYARRAKERGIRPS